MNLKNLSDKELEQKIKEASKAYGSASPIMSDLEFDSLINEKKRRSPDYEDTVTYTEENLEGFKKMKHNMTTGTLAKCRNEDEFVKWHQKQPEQFYVAETKIDGCGAELIYEKGVLTAVITRGDGFEGRNVYENAKKFIPNKIDESFTGSIRGEYLLKKDVFEKYFSDKANIRNASGGIISRLDGENVDKLSFIAYDIKKTLIQGTSNYTYNLDVLETLSLFGFEVPEYKLCYTSEEILKWREEVSARRNDINYDIDGIVIKPNEIDYDDLQIRTPKKSCAIKFDLEEVVSEVVDIEWSLTGSILSPIAVIKPVELYGTTVKRASCSNARLMEDLGIEIGCKVLISKAGEIIPKIIKVVK